jgi:Protein of unknown function (DUF1570)
MKRCLLAIVALVVVNCGLASADYVLVKIDLNQILNPPKQGAGGPGNPNFPGGAGGFQGKGGGKGGALTPYQQSLQAAAPGQPGPAAQPKGPQEPPIYVYAYVETKKPIKQINVANKQIPFNIYDVEYKAGNQKMDLWIPEITLNNNTSALIFKRGSVNSQFATKLQNALKDGTDDSKKKNLLTAAEWGLQRGLLTEFTNAIEELKKLDPKSAVVAAAAKVREELKNKPSADDPAAQALITEMVRRDAYRPLVSDEGHYTLLTNPGSTRSDAELKKKLSRLEEVYSAFFYWHALKGASRMPPPYRLAVVLFDFPENKVSDFHKKHEQFNFVPMVGGGFTAQRDNVLVVASRRMDEAYEKLSSYLQTKLDEYAIDPADLLTNVTKIYASPQFLQQMQQAQKQPMQVLAVMQTLALCQKAMNDETELLGLSHGGVRQLIAATGIMPRNVETAEWARFGLASFFEVPAHSFYPSTGGTNWDRLVEFKALRKAKVLDQKAARDILVKTITDDYFRQAQSARTAAEASAKDDQGLFKRKAKEDLSQAQATAWSLMHYLAIKKHPQLERYFEELRNLPRDLAYDSKVLRDCFYRAFGLMRDDPDNPNHKIVDVVKLSNLSNDWFNDAEKSFLDNMGPMSYETMAVQWRMDELKVGRPQPGSGALPVGPGAPGGQPGQGTLPGTGNPPGLVLPPDKSGGNRN